MAPGQHVGYVRVSTVDQKADRQLAGVDLDKTFSEKLSGKGVARPILQEVLGYVREGDTLHIHSIDRLARNLQDLLELLQILVGKGVTVKFHKEGLTFAGTEDPFQRLQLQVIGAVAEFERALIKERQREGIAVARKAGKHLGRARSLSPDQVAEIRVRLAKGEQKQDLAKEFGVGRSTLYRALATPNAVK